MHALRQIASGLACGMHDIITSLLPPYRWDLCALFSLAQVFSVDLDEYLFLGKHDSLKSLLREYRADPDLGSLSIKSWTYLPGSGEPRAQPPHSVLHAHC